MAGGVTCSISHEKLKVQVHTIWCQINPPSECSLPESQTKPDMSHFGCYLGPQGTCLWQMHTALMTEGRKMESGMAIRQQRVHIFIAALQ